MIVCGIQAGRGQLSLEWVIAFAALGAFIGDNISYLIGRYAGQPAVKRFFSGEKAQARLQWTRNFLTERGSYVLIVARFVPGGRTAATFTSGLVHLAWMTRFAPFVFIAGIFWATFGALLGYLGGRTFENKPLYALLLAFGIAATLTLGAEGLRRWRGRQG